MWAGRWSPVGLRLVDPPIADVPSVHPASSPPLIRVSGWIVGHFGAATQTTPARCCRGRLSEAGFRQSRWINKFTEYSRRTGWRPAQTNFADSPPELGPGSTCVAHQRSLVNRRKPKPDRTIPNVDVPTANAMSRRPRSRPKTIEIAATATAKNRTTRTVRLLGGVNIPMWRTQS